MSDSVTRSDNKQAELLDRILTIGQAVQQHIQENPKEVYELIVGAVCEVTGADCAVIYPYHPSFGEFYDVDNIAAYGLRHELSVEKRADKRRRLAARVHQEGEVICEDIEREEPHLPSEISFITREGIRAFMGLSLRVGDNILGILYVDYRQPHHFSEEEKQIIRLLGQQAAIAISNSWTSRLASMRADAVSKLKTIEQSLFTVEDPSKALADVLDGIAHSAQVVLGADLVDLYQYIQARDEFALPPTRVGERLHDQLIPTKIYDDDVVVAAVKMGAPKYFHYAQKTSLLTADFETPHDGAPDERFVVREEVASSAMIPLMAAGETVGVMFVNYRTPQFFSQEQRDVIETFAAQAAVAIRNARLFQQVSDQSQVLTELNELTPHLVSIQEKPKDTRGLLEQVARSAKEVLRADIIELYEYLQSQNEYRLPQISVGERRGELVPKDKIYEDDAVFQLIHREEPIYVEDVQSDTILSGPYTVEREGQPTERFVAREQIQSTAAIPLRTGTETVGLMFASYRTPQSFTKEQREVIKLFANQAGIAIHNSRLFNESLRQRNELQVVDEIGKLLVSTLDPREIPRMLLQQVIRLFGVEGASLWQVDQANQSVRCLFSLDRRGDEAAFIDIMKSMVFRLGQGIVGTVAELGKPMIFNKAQTEPRWDKRVDEATGFETRSILAVPLVHKKETIGVIEVLNRLNGLPFADEDQDFLAAIVSPAAVALENARLFYDVNQKLESANQALERRVEALSILNEVGQELTSGIRMKEEKILELIYKQARGLTGTQEMYIALYDETTELIRFGPAMEKGQRVTIDPRKADMERRGKTEEVIFTREPILHRTEQEVEDWYKLPGHEAFRRPVAPSWMGVPMITGDRAQGMIAVYDWERENAYDEQDLQVLSSMASQAAIALDNANLLREYATIREELIATRQLAALGTVTAAIQHRINNTLNIIRPNIIRLRRRVDLSDGTIQEILDIIERNTRYTSEYINRIQEPLKETEVQAVDVNVSLREACAQVWEQYQGRASFGVIKVVYKLDDSLPLIEASLGQITEIFRNLTENSYKAMAADGGTLTIVSQYVDNWLEVEIQDTGPGIPPNICDRLFIKPVPSRQPGAGSGLGLWLTNLLLQKYAGEIIIKNTGVDGTTILVRLPVSKSQEQV